MIKLETTPPLYKCYEENKFVTDPVYALNAYCDLMSKFIEDYEHLKENNKEIWALKKKQLIGSINHLKWLNNNINISEQDFDYEETKKFQDDMNKLLDLKLEQINLL